MADRNVVDAPLAPAPEKASMFEDFIDMFHAPSKVFARRATSGFWIITLVLTVISAIFAFASSATVDTLMEAQFRTTAAEMMEQNPEMTEDQVNSMRRIGTMSMKAAMYVAMPFLVLFIGLLVWVSGKMFGAGLTFTAAAMIAAYSQIPRLLQSLLFLVQGLVMEAPSGFHAFSFSPARFMDPATTSAGLMGLLARFDLFIIWLTILYGIGISVVGRIPRSKGMAAAVVIWLIATLPAVWGLLMS